MGDTTLTAIIPNLPDFFRPNAGKEFPQDIIGSKVFAMGTLDFSMGIEGGGLVIDYIPTDSEYAKRMVLGFNELGMWVVSSH